MQTQKIYVRADSVLATFVDSFNQTTTATFPTLARGQSAELLIGFFANADADTQMTQAEVQQYVAWDFGYDSDYNTQTTPKIRTTTGFSVDEDGFLHIPIDTTTAELKTAMGNSETLALSAELDGYLAGEPDAPAVIIQWNGQSFRNRIIEGGTGEPEPVDDGVYTKAQVDALVGGEIVYQFSEDGESWHDTQTSDDVYFRSKNGSLSTGAWSEAMLLPEGQQGEEGVSNYVHIAYASDSTGSDISFTPTNSLKYRAEIVNTSPTATTTDFAEATWVKYLGDDGQGVGDMTKAVYDVNNNGKVDHAELADEATAVAWTGITGKPESFTPSAHTHEQGDIADPVVQVFATSSLAVTELALDKPIVRINGGVSGSITIDILAIVDKDGNPATIEQTKAYTWEYHVRATGVVNDVTVGSQYSTMFPISIPETLPLVMGNPTWHVFTIRGFYKTGAINNISLGVNYAYSYAE
jgi:hypothetical protein